MKSASSLVSLLLIFSIVFLDACNDDTTVINGNWKPGVDFAGPRSSGLFSFVIGNLAYVGLGDAGASSDVQNPKRVFSYSATSGFWKELGEFPGFGRTAMVSFSLNGKGYIGGGFRNGVLPSLAPLQDFWEYDPGSDTWTQIADFPYKIYGGTAFTTPEGAFVGTGNDGSNYHNDFYRYDAGNNEWVQVASVNKKKWKAMSMVIGGKAYLIGGDNSNSSVSYDFYEFDPANNKWIDRSTLTADANYADFQAAVRRSAGTAFTLNDLGYVVCGVFPGSSSANSLTYQYNPATSTWTKMTNFEGGNRQLPVSFVVENRAFVGMGSNATVGNEDLYEWQPLAAYDAVN